VSCFAETCHFYGSAEPGISTTIVRGVVETAARDKYSDKAAFPWQGHFRLWIVIRHRPANGDGWSTETIHFRGACLQRGNDPQRACARTRASQTPHIAFGPDAGATVIAAPDSSASPVKIHGPDASG
jgi:hypothetical protein